MSEGHLDSTPKGPSDQPSKAKQAPTSSEQDLEKSLDLSTGIEKGKESEEVMAFEEAEEK